MAKGKSTSTSSTSTSLPPYDWQSKPPTRDTDAAAEKVLRDLGKARRF